ncbi:glycerol kinase GlpK [Paenibacillus sp. P36]|uniref:glycerol kinase GlpK n=1 Tax=Paenibacillus sp. P36 TaxID=3342538 RepID=UPI0038B24755
MTKDYILAIDQSTSGTKALLVNRAGQAIAQSSAEHRQYYPSQGWVEHDPLEIYQNVVNTARQVLQKAGIRAGQLAALTITNQRETALLWDRVTGLPVHPAIVWQCQRTADMCEALRLGGHEVEVRAKTGLVLDPYFSATKWRWMIEHVDGVKEKVSEGRLLAGTIDSWLLWKLTGGRIHATDYTNASRTSLFNIHSLQWDNELCELFQVDKALLPEVKCSDELFGVTADPDLFEDQVPISGIIGDSQAALFGNQCFKPGMAKATYGTGTSILMNVGEQSHSVGNSLVTAVAWGLGGRITYALEAVIRTSGDCIKWTRDNLALFHSFEEMEELLKQAEHNEGVYLVPAFVGLGAPYWAADARAAIVGMNRGTTKAHVVRAALESIAYQVYEAIELIQNESGVPIQELKADGGATANPNLMQFQADILQRNVIKSEVAELSAMGSVYMGGLGTDFWSSQDEIASLQKSFHVYTPDMSDKQREQYVTGWKRAVAGVLSGLS